jgi:hypothetical protein
MSKLEVLFQQRGTGYLILKRGICKQIEWEIEVLRDGSIKGGSVRGDKKHLKAAAKDGCVKLSLTSEITVAIAINRYKDGEAFFTAFDFPVAAGFCCSDHRRIGSDSGRQYLFN